MSILKNIPLSFLGELHDIRLINFYVPLGDVLPHVPEPLRVRDFGGKALISMVNVDLKNMRLRRFPFLKFNYRHIAFRLLVDDSAYTGNGCKGIFFLKSFSSDRLMCAGGNAIADFNFSRAKIKNVNDLLELNCGDKFIRYAIDVNAPVKENTKLRETIGSIDRAYSVNNGQVKMLRILRERWPIEAAECYHFETNFFSKTELAGVFTVKETIFYQWLPAEKAEPCVSSFLAQTAV